MNRTVALAALLAAACASSPTPTQPQPQPPPQYGNQYPPQQYPPQQYPPQYPPQQYPQQYPPQQYPPQQYPPQQNPQQYPQPQPRPQPAPGPQRPLLFPLIGPIAWQNEVRSVLAELIASLSATNAGRVRGIPLVFDPNPNEVNAFAGCDEKGAPYLAGTEGLLEAVDAIAQTKATDELYGTTTYEQYASTVIPQLVKSDKASPALPLGIIPPQALADPRRLSRAHEIYDDIVAFTFGHELGHHYLGHTGCANGQGMSGGPNPAGLANLATNILPGLNQPNEVAADGAGCINVLDAGRARMQTGFRWTEAGALALLDYFARMDRASGVSPLNPIGFLRSHPNPQFRIPIVQAVARTWWLQHPG
jgi:hypothetical protein